MNLAVAQVVEHAVNRGQNAIRQFAGCHSTGSLPGLFCRYRLLSDCGRLDPVSKTLSVFRRLPRCEDSADQSQGRNAVVHSNRPPMSGTASDKEETSMR